MLSISIVIYAFDPKVLTELFLSLSAAIDNLPEAWQPISIDIVDNGNQLAQISAVISEFSNELPGLKALSSEKNIGYGQAHNLIINRTGSKYHLILNPDVIVDKNALLEGIKFLETETKVSAVAPHAVNEKRETQFLCKQYPSVLDLTIRGMGIKNTNSWFQERMGRYESRDKAESGLPVEAEIISGCFMLCRTAHLKKIGGFDKRYFLYFEDFALSIELSRVGKLYYLPSMNIVHYGGNASRKSIKHIIMFISSAIKFFNQYYWKIY